MAVHYPPWVKLRGVYPPWIFTKSLLGRLLTWNRSSLWVTERLVKLEEWRCTQGAACLNFGQQCLNAFISSDRRKLNYRRVEVGRIFLIVFFYFEQKFLLLLSAFLWYTFIFNSKNKHRKPHNFTKRSIIIIAVNKKLFSHHKNKIYDMYNVNV